MRPIKRKVPQRTCVACRGVGDKGRLVRLVKQPDGDVVVDEVGRLPGRGAYLCRRTACWQEAAVRLEYALKTRLSLETKERLLAYGKEITISESQA